MHPIWQHCRNYLVLSCSNAQVGSHFTNTLKVQKLETNIYIFLPDNFCHYKWTDKARHNQIFSATITALFD